MAPQPGFRVVIVGGSIAGLTLAHCLHKANIDHIVLEKGDDIAPQLGASIAIMPNGARVLQQLGLYDQVESLIEPLSVAHVTYPDGFAFSSPYPKSINQRFGYPIAFLDRQKLLEILYQSYPDKTKILTGKRVIQVRRLGRSGSCVVTDDGAVYKGDLIAGADGVHSRIRAEMWRLAEGGAGAISPDEKKSMTVEYACVFGISTSLPSLATGEQTNVFCDGLTVVTIHGKHGRVYWFVIRKLDRKYIYPDVYRFSDADAAQLCEYFADVHIWKDVFVRDIWEKRIASSMTALEESVFGTWFYERMVLLGDSVHKMTINFGQGANCAIEDAALLSSLLHDFVTRSPSQQEQHPDTNIESVLKAYQGGRYNRVKDIYNASWFVVRLQARDGFLNALFGRYYAPYAGDVPADMASKVIADAEVVRFLPLPGRSGTGWERYSRYRRGGGVGLSQWVVLVVAVVVGLAWWSRGGEGVRLDYLLGVAPYVARDTE